MKPADDLPPEQLIGKIVRFKEDGDHHACWHHRVGLKTGVVLRLGQTRAQKAELLETAGFALPEVSPDDETPRVWVHADPCTSFSQGCEAAVAQDCLLVIDS